jgi:type VI secretion system protein ImpH
MDDPLIQKMERDAPRFAFFQLVRLLEAMHPDAPRIGGPGPARREILRFRPEMSLTFPTADVADVRREDGADERPRRFLITARIMGLYGVTSPLPSYYTETIYEEDDPEAVRVRAFLDVFHHRLLSLLYRAWAKYRYPVRFRPDGGDEFSRVLLPLTGRPDAPAAEDVPQMPLLRALGLTTQLPRSAESLRAFVSDFFGGLPVRVTQCVRRWVTIASDQRNNLGRKNARLGEDALAGTRVLDVGGKFRLTLGPLDWDDFTAFLPSNPDFRRLCGLVRLYVLDALDFEVELVLKREQLPPLKMGQGSPSFLGWTTWAATTSGPDLSVVLPPARAA